MIWLIGQVVFLIFATLFAITILLPVISIIIGIIDIRKTGFRKYTGAFSLLAGIAIIIMIFIMKKDSKSLFENLILAICIGVIALLINAVLNSLYELYCFFKKMYKLIEEKRANIIQNNKNRLKENREKYLLENINNTMTFNILFIYSNNDNLSNMKKNRINEIVEKYGNSILNTINTDEYSDVNIREQYNYNSYPFIVILREGETVYSKEGLFRLKDIEIILKG